MCLCLCMYYTQECVRVSTIVTYFIKQVEEEAERVRLVAAEEQRKVVECVCVCVQVCARVCVYAYYVLVYMCVQSTLFYDFLIKQAGEEVKRLRLAAAEEQRKTAELQKQVCARVCVCALYMYLYHFLIKQTAETAERLRLAAAEEQRKLKVFATTPTTTTTTTTTATGTPTLIITTIINYYYYYYYYY